MAFLGALEGLGSAVEAGSSFLSAIADEGAAATGTASGLYGAARAADYIHPKQWSEIVGMKRSDPPVTPVTPPRRVRRRFQVPGPPRKILRPPMANPPVVKRPEMFFWLPTETRQRIARVRRAKWKLRHFRNSRAASKIQRAFRRNYFRRPKRSSFVKYSKYSRPKWISSGTPYWNRDFTRVIYPKGYWGTEDFGPLRRLKHRASRVYNRRTAYNKRRRDKVPWLY